MRTLRDSLKRTCKSGVLVSPAERIQQQELLDSFGKIKPSLDQLAIFLNHMPSRTLFEQTMRCFICALLDIDSSPVDSAFPETESRCKASNIVANFFGVLTARQLFLLHKVESSLSRNKNVVSSELQKISEKIAGKLENEVCAICLMELDSAILVPRCCHAIHADCFSGLAFKDVGPHAGKCRSCLQPFRWGNEVVRGNMMSMMWHIVDRTLARMRISDDIPDEDQFIAHLAERVSLETGTTLEQVMAENAAVIAAREARAAARARGSMRMSSRLTLL